MKMITPNGLYFSGKIRDLLKELHELSKEYTTLREVITKNMQ